MTLQIANVSCVAIGGRAIMIEGPPGSGKTSLALSLIDRGAQLVGDDAIELTGSDGPPLAGPVPQIAGKIEVRNVGIVELPTTRAPLALILSLGDDAERYPLAIAERTVMGAAIPSLKFRPGDAIQALRAEYALEKHGLPLRPSPSSGAKDKS